MNKDAKADATSRLLNDTITIKRDEVVDRVVRIKVVEGVLSMYQLYDTPSSSLC